MADDLLKMMQQWMTHLENSAGTASGNAPFQPWWEFTQEQQSVADRLSPQQAELLALLTQQSLEFTRFGEQLIAQLEQHGTHTEASELVNQFHNHLRQLTQEWILKRWQLPEQLGALFHTHSFQDDLLLDNPFIHGLKSLLNAPAQLGLQHSLQRQLKEGVDLLVEYEQALRDYSAHYAKINSGATAHFLEQIEQAAPPIDSLRTLHTLWVDAYENDYALQIATTEYRDAHGRISNAVMNLRLFLQNLRNTQLQQFGIPNTEQLDLIYQRMNAQRRELKNLRREIESFASLQAEMDLLKSQLAALQDKVVTKRAPVRRTTKSSTKPTKSSDNA